MSNLLKNTRNKMIFLLFLIIFLPLTLASILIIWNIYQSIYLEQKAKLRGISIVLERELVGDYNSILAQEKALNAPLEEKTAIFNARLGPFAEKIARIENVMAVGYYSVDLKANIVYAPGKNYSSRLGKNFVEDNPLREIYITEKPIFTSGNSSRGSVLVYGQPIFRHGELIGHTFASIPSLYLYQHLYPRALRVLIILFITFLTLFLAGLIITDYVRKDIRITRRSLTNPLNLDIRNNTQKELYFVEELPGLINACQRSQRIALEEIAFTNEARHRWENIYNHIFTVLSIGCLITDRDKIITNFNSQIGAILGLEAEEILGRRLEELASYIKLNHQIEFLEGEKDSGEGILELTNHCGLLKKVWVNLSKIRNEEGDLLGIIILLQDKNN